MTMSHHPVSRVAAAGGFVLLYTSIKKICNCILYYFFPAARARYECSGTSQYCMHVYIYYIYIDRTNAMLCDMIVFVG